MKASPARTGSTKAGSDTTTYLTVSSKTPKREVLIKTTILQNLPPGSKPRYGTGAINTVDIYNKYGKDSFTKNRSPFTGLPGIYVITPCADDRQTPCVAANFIPVKIGTATDLSKRLDGYHTYLPYGFTILRIYVLERVMRTATERTHRPFTSADIAYGELDNMLQTAETHILRYFHYSLPFNKLAITRPARSEWFRVDLPPDELETNLKKLDTFVTTLKLLAPSMPRTKTSPLYGTFFKGCCTHPRFSVNLEPMSAAEELRRFRDVPDPITTATLVQKTQWISTISKAAKNQTLAVIDRQLVDEDGNVLPEPGSASAAASGAAASGAAASGAAAAEEKEESKEGNEEEEDETYERVSKRLKFSGGFIQTFFGVGGVA